MKTLRLTHTGAHRPPSRRLLLQGIAAAPLTLAAGAAHAQDAPALPLAATFIEHLGTVVPDVAAAARFHSKLFNPAIMREQQNPPLRAYVDLKSGYLAFGARANATRAFFDHFCVLLQHYDQETLALRLEAEGFSSSPPFTLFQDPDGAGVQLYRDPGGWFPTVVPAEPLATGPALVEPHGLAHVMLNVADVDASAAFYRHWFGPLDRRASPELAWFEFPGNRLGLRRTPDGETPGVASIRVRVDPFDRGDLTVTLKGMGATVSPASADEPRVLAFTDPVGLQLELAPV